MHDIQERALSSMNYFLLRLAYTKATQSTVYREGESECGLDCYLPVLYEDLFSEVEVFVTEMGKLVAEGESEILQFVRAALIAELVEGSCLDSERYAELKIPESEYPDCFAKALEETLEDLGAGAELRAFYHDSIKQALGVVNAEKHEDASQEQEDGYQ